MNPVQPQIAVTRNVMNYRFAILAFCAFALLAPRNSWSQSQQYCVVCNSPDQTYLCQVNTPRNNQGDKGMQLFCIIEISKDGGHKSCAVRDSASAVCTGPVKTFTFQDPAISSQIKSAAEKIRNSRNPANDIQDAPPNQNRGEPKTLIEMTGRAVKASRNSLKNTGQAVSGAASSTSQKVGKAARGAGKGVTNTAKKVGTATKKTGSTVGNAAKTAFNCLKSWFKDCSAKQQEQLPAPQ